MTTNANFYQEPFINKMIKLFPQTKTWFNATPQSTEIDIENLLTTMGFKIIQKDLATDYKSKLVGNVLYLNSNITNEAQRFEIARTIGLLVIKARKQTIKPIKHTVPTGIQLLPAEVVDFLNTLQFQMLTTNSLPNAISALEDYSQSDIVDDNDPVKTWYQQDVAQAQLANAYLHGFEKE